MANSLLARQNQYPAHFRCGARPDKISALSSQALALSSRRAIARGVAHYEQILALKPRIPEIHNNRGLALAALGKFEEAAQAYRRATKIRPDNPETLCNWGVALAQLERYDEAEAKFRRAIAVSPGFAGAYNNLGLILKEQGRITESGRRSRTGHPSVAARSVVLRQSRCTAPFAAGDHYFTALETMAANPASLSATNRMHLHFALAKTYEHVGRPDNAFQHLLAGNALKRAQISYDEAATLAQMDRTRELFTREFISDREGRGERSPVPLFIVGMPRSGTTLIEQILASHPDIFGAGELSLFEQTVDSVRDALPQSPAFPDMASCLSARRYSPPGRTLSRDAYPARAACGAHYRQDAGEFFVCRPDPSGAAQCRHHPRDA